MDCITVYTNGSCTTNPGIGGWAFVVAYSDGESCKWGNSQQDTTSNIMELVAIEKVLEYCTANNYNNVIVKSNSKYAIGGITKWLSSWKSNEWKTANNKDITNKHIWVSLDEKIQQMTNIQWTYIESRNEDRYSIMADKLASDAATNDVIESEWGL